jgi:adenylyl- and sulfurtransferase ThiI
LIKYGEIGVKGKNRFIFEDALVRQIKFSLKDVEGEFDVRRADGRKIGKRRQSTDDEKRCREKCR